MRRITRILTSPTGSEGSEGNVVKLSIKYIFASVALVAAFASAGCGGDAHSEQGDRLELRGPVELAEFLRTTIAYDYEPHDSPRELLASVDIAVVGEVESLDAGTIEAGNEDTGVVVLALGIEEVWKADISPVPSRVYCIFHRPTNLDTDLYASALPKGLRIALFGHHSAETLTQGDPGQGFYDPDPQGLILEVSEATTVNVWGDDARSAEWRGVESIDDLRVALNQD